MKKRSPMIITVISIMAAAMLICSTAVAASFRVEESYAGAAADDVYAIGTSCVAEWTDVSDSLTFEVTYHKTAGNSRGRFDLAVTAETGSVELAGYSAEVRETSSGKAFIFRDIAHSAADGGVMSLSLSLSAVSGKVRAGVAAAAGNVYVADEYDLRYLNDERLFNPYYDSPSGGWTELGSAPFSVSGTSVTLSVDGGEVTGTLDETDEILTLDCRSFVFKSLKIAGAGQLTFYLRDGKYVNPSYGVRLTVSEGAAKIETQPYSAPLGFKNVYLVGEVEVSSPLTLSAPVRLNTFIGSATLSAPMNIAHGYAGAYTLESPLGAGVDNSAFPLTVSAPYAYYDREKLAAAVTAPANLTVSDASDGETADGEEALAAGEYIEEFLPDAATGDIILPAGYGSFRATYAYSFGEGIDGYGRIERREAGFFVTANVSVSVGGAVLATAHKEIYVVGTSESSVAEYFCGVLTDYIAVDDGAGTVFVGSADLLYAMKTRLFGAGFGGTVKLTAGAELKFVLHGGGVAAEGTEIVCDGETVSVFADGVAAGTTAVAEADALYLSAKGEITDAADTGVTVSYGFDGTDYASSTLVALTVKGMDFARKTAYLERFYETMYVSDTDTKNYILRVSGDAVYRGEIAEGNKVISSSLGLSGIEYGFYVCAESDLQRYTEGALAVEELLALSVRNDSLFVKGDGYVTPAGKIVLTESRALFTLITAAFDTTVDAEKSYLSVREVIIPDGGVGGNDYTQYTKGDTFAPYFESLVSNMLIDSTADTAEANGNAHRFMSDTDGVLLEMSVENPEDTAGGDGVPFCRLVYNASGRYYQIDIDADNIPSVDTTVRLKAVFYFVDAEDVRTVISEQKYSFVIPGIYKRGRDVADDAVYDRMLEVYENFNGYLLVGGAEADVPVFDCSASVLGVSGTVDVRGLEILKNTSSIILDGVRPASLAPFKNFTSFNLVSLGLSGCGITDAMISDGAPLYNLVGLTKIDLSGNRLTALAGATPQLYRTVTDLNVSGQRNDGERCLVSLDWLGTLPEIAVLDVSDNGIRSFAPLADCRNLVRVALGGNQARDFSGKNGDTLSYYGSSGAVNVPVYAVLQSRGIEVTGDAEPLFGDDERKGAELLNAISVFSTQYGAISLPGKLYVSDTSSDAYYGVSCVYLVRNMEAVEFTAAEDGDKLRLTSALSDGDKVSAIVKLTVNGTDVYKQFEFTYRVTA